MFSPWRDSPDESPAGGLTGTGIHVLDSFRAWPGRCAARPARSLLSHRPAPDPLDTLVGAARIRGAASAACSARCARPRLLAGACLRPRWLGRGAEPHRADPAQKRPGSRASAVRAGRLGARQSRSFCRRGRRSRALSDQPARNRRCRRRLRGNRQIGGIRRPPTGRLIGMANCETLPYGAWRSPITSELIVGETLGLGDIRVDGARHLLDRGRPGEGGRNVLVRRCARRRRSTDITPRPFSVRTRVHEYGGGAMNVHRGLSISPILPISGCTSRPPAWSRRR